MRARIVLFLLIFISFEVIAQDISGIWTGYIHNDSNNLNLRYEVAITEYKGKYKGFSSTIFIVDSKELTGVKSLKVTMRNGKVVLEDDELVYNNYHFEPPKGVRQVSVLSLENDNSVLAGKFTTTRTKQFGRPVTGIVRLEKKTLQDSSVLLSRLHKLGLYEDLSFAKPTEDPLAAKPLQQKTDPAKVADPLKEVASRKTETIRTIYFSSDSLRVEVFDNGYVDGDSISIILNGKMFMQHVRLTEKPVGKTIHIDAVTGDSLNLVMFAENLGSIPPNSGYAFIYDGVIKHQVTFSGDMNRNAAIILKRKR